MKKLFLIMFLLFTNNILANNLPEFKKYTSYSKNISLKDIVKKEELFFGTNKTYLSSASISTNGLVNETVDGVLTGLGTASSDLAKGFMKEGIKSSVAGLGIGFVIGGIKAINQSVANKKFDSRIEALIHVPFYLVEKITNKKGESTIKRTMIIFNKIKNKNFKNDKKTLAYVKAKIKG